MAGRELPKTFSADEVQALMAVPNLAAPTGLRNRGMLAVMHRCGFRVGDVSGVHLRDVRWQEGTIHLRPEFTKGGVEAFQPVDDQTLALLERWVDTRRRYAARKPHLFTTLQGGPVDRRYLWHMVRRYARRAGIDRPTKPHMLRHTYATELLTEGFNIREVQRLMRHADIRTTVIYTHISDQALQEKIRART